MGIEAIAPRRGEVRTSDLRALLGAELATLECVTVTVVAQTGGAVTVRIELADLRAGLRTHRALLCPWCREPRHVLIAREGALKCSKCHRYRTRRQAEWNLASWNRLGGELEDRMLRLLHPTARRTRPRLLEARRLAKTLLAADRQRVEVLREELQALMLCADTRSAG